MNQQRIELLGKLKIQGVSSRAFTLPGKKKLQEPDCQIEVVVVDVTQTPIERRQKNKSSSTVVKKKRHTLKSQLVVNQATREIICTAHGKGKEHDFRLFRSKTRLRENIKLLGDKGYQGIQKLHSTNSETPKNKPRGKNLSIADKKKNRELARIRVIGENINCQLKGFKILSNR
jgi:hypothetical protein